jgi:glycosyltransferase involved in cell wall biosynthesis
MAETTGMVTLEAMAMGKAVIASNEDWSQAIIENSVNGFRIDPQDAIAFAGVVCELLNDPEKVKAVGFEARRKIEEEFDAKIIAKKNIDFYSELVSGDRSSSQSRKSK